jgi:SLOG-like protein
MSDTQTMAAGWKLALSVSETPDLEVLGLFEDDDKRFLSAILTPLVYRGARIAYGGRIEPASGTNFTQEISTQLAEAYRQIGSKPGSRPLIHYLRDNDARDEGIEKLLAHALKLGSYSEIKLLRGETIAATLLPSGSDLAVYVDGAEAAIVSKADELMAVPQISEIFAGPAGRDELADMRVAMARETDARIILGGRVTKVSKGIPGIAAEALATLGQAKPLLVIGGIGGASRDVAWALGLIDDAERVDRDDAVYRDNDNQPSKDRYWAQMEKLRGFAADYRAMLEKQGLFEDARRLAISESHAEIGTLVITMLGKLLGAGSGKPNG